MSVVQVTHKLRSRINTRGGTDKLSLDGGRIESWPRGIADPVQERIRKCGNVHFHVPRRSRPCDEFRREVEANQRMAEVHQLSDQSARLDRHPWPCRQVRYLAIAWSGQRMAPKRIVAILVALHFLNRLVPLLGSRLGRGHLGPRLGELNEGRIQLIAGNDFLHGRGFEAVDAIFLDFDFLLGAALLDARFGELVLQIEPNIRTDADVHPTERLSGTDPLPRRWPGQVRGAPQRAGERGANLRGGPWIGDDSAVNRCLIVPLPRSRRFRLQAVALRFVFFEFDDPFYRLCCRRRCFLLALILIVFLTHFFVYQKEAEQSAAEQAESQQPFERSYQQV